MTHVWSPSTLPLLRAQDVSLSKLVVLLIIPVLTMLDLAPAKPYLWRAGLCIDAHLAWRQPKSS